VIFDPLGSRNCWTDWDETWHGWLRRWPHPTCTKRKVYVKGVVCGWGENVQPKRAFFLFLSVTVTSIFQLNFVAVIFYLECSGKWCNGRRGDQGVGDGRPPARSRGSPG